MLLYLLELTMKRGPQFGMLLYVDDKYDDDGDWTVTAPGDHYFGRERGYWILRRMQTAFIEFYNKRNPNVVVLALTLGQTFNDLLGYTTVSSLYSAQGFLSHYDQGSGVIIDSPHYLDFFWKVLRRFD